MSESLKTSQASFEVQPRVFYEDFRNYVLYIQDVRPAAGAALWHHVFLADLTQPANPHITTADQAVVVNGTITQTIRLHLLNGGQHETSTNDPNQYNISTFASTDLPIQTEHPGRPSPRPLRHPHPRALRSPNSGAAATRLTAPSTGRAARLYRIEFNRRFSYPFACLVLMLVGVPLGISSKRGGKSTGFVLTILLVFIYYFLSLGRRRLRQKRQALPLLGVWGANLLFAAAGALLLYQMSRGGIALGLFSSIGVWLNKLVTRLTRGRRSSPSTRSQLSTSPPFSAASAAPSASSSLSCSTTTSCASTPPTSPSCSSPSPRSSSSSPSSNSSATSSATALRSSPSATISSISSPSSSTTSRRSAASSPFSSPSARSAASSELTAMKATGISLYRIVTPVLVTTLLISGGLFAFDELYLPAANRRQEALRSIIKDKPAQTFLRPDRKWISGQAGIQCERRRASSTTSSSTPTRTSSPTSPSSSSNPTTFTLERRIFASSAHWNDRVNQWVFENGWQRTFSGETIASYQPFTLTTFPEIHEQPTYFVKEDRPSQEMSYNELSRYIADLNQSGFDTKRLSVQLNRKLAYPLITLVMAMLAIPFALSMGKRGSLAGIATAIGLAIAYWVVDGLFQAMGNVNTLPAILAAWTPDLLFGIAGTYLLLRTPT